MKNIHVLPTDKPSRLFKAGYYLYPNNELVVSINPNCINQNIYITSDEKPKQGEWSLYQNKIHKCIEDIIGDEFKKIILTTDQDLIKDGVQAIDDEFLEWFVNNPSCEYVEIQPDKVYNKNRDSISYYKIIIPKKELNIKELNRLDDIEIEEMSNDWETMSKQIEPKQETLEEAAVNCWAEGAWDNRDDFTDGFVEGVKWQQKRSYSEEDMKEMYLKGIENYDSTFKNK